METITAPLIENPETDDLTKRLELAGIDWRKWQSGRLAELRRRLKTEKYKLAIVDGRLAVRDQVAVVIVRHIRKEDGQHLELYEAGQTFNGTDLVRPFDGIGESIRIGEFPRTAAIRCLEEEPGSEEPGFKDPSNYALSELRGHYYADPVESEKYSGLLGVHERWIFHCRIREKIFRPPGYIETEPDGRRIYLAWKEIPRDLQWFNF